jgi:hypothetical protein
MHDEDPGFVNRFLPTEREVFRSDVFFLGDSTDETHDERVFSPDDTRNFSTARQFLTLLKLCDVTCGPVNEIYEAQSANDIKLLFVDCSESCLQCDPSVNTRIDRW